MSELKLRPPEVISCVARLRRMCDYRGLSDDEDHIFCVLDTGGERVCVSADCAVGWIDLRICVYASIFGAQQKTVEIFVAGVGGGIGIRNEFASDRACGAVGIYLYGGWNCDGDDARIFTGEGFSGGREGLLFDYGGNGDLRRQRDCGRGSDYECGGRRYCGFDGDDFCAEFDCAICVSGDWRRAALEPVTIRFVGGAGDTRYKFGGGSGGEVRRGSAGNWDDGETSSSAVDCAGGAGNGVLCEKQGADSVAVVHIVFLSGGSGEYVFAGARAGVCRAQ
jgi:hypothetical protein